jgi:hypothetical protein
MCDQETSKNEKAIARYRAVENTTTMGSNARKTNKQTNNNSSFSTLRKAQMKTAKTILSLSLSLITVSYFLSISKF